MADGDQASSLFEQPNPMKILGGGILAVTVFVLWLITVLVQFNSDGRQLALTVANLLSGLGSFFLVLLTGLYTLWTRRLVSVEFEARETQRIETWYGETLSIVRQLESEWRFLLRERVGEDGYAHLEDHPESRDRLTSLVHSLEEQISSRPGAVDDSIPDTAENFIDGWRLIIRSNDPRVGVESGPGETDMLDSLESLRRELKEHSEWYGGQ
jgi:hypothetical protein